MPCTVKETVKIFFEPAPQGTKEEIIPSVFVNIDGHYVSENKQQMSLKRQRSKSEKHLNISDKGAKEEIMQSVIMPERVKEILLEMPAEDAERITARYHENESFRLIINYLSESSVSEIDDFLKRMDRLYKQYKGAKQ